MDDAGRDGYGVSKAVVWTLEERVGVVSNLLLIQSSTAVQLDPFTCKAIV